MAFGSGVARRACGSVGALGAFAGCAGMVAMLPGAVAGVLGAIGITGSSAFAQTLAPVAEPLFIASAVLLVLGALTCGRLVALLAVAGNVLLYLSMFQLASIGSIGGASSHGSMSMMNMQQPHDGSATPAAEPTSFYLGLALLVTAFGLSVWRRHRRECQPLVRLRIALR